MNCVKMTVLPSFLYLFQCLPIFLSKAFFNTLDKLISSFIWDGKTPGFVNSFSRKCDVGLALTNLHTIKYVEVKTSTFFSESNMQQSFLPANLDSASKQCQDKGIAQFGDLYIDGFASFSDLCSKFNLIQLTLSITFRYVIL